MGPNGPPPLAGDKMSKQTRKHPSLCQEWFWRAEQYAEAGVAQQMLRRPSASKPRIAAILAAALVTCLSLAPVRGRTYPTQYLPTVWQTEQGLPANSVTALLQDHDGYFWIGTFGGLARFDGQTLPGCWTRGPHRVSTTITSSRSTRVVRESFGSAP